MRTYTTLDNGTTDLVRIDGFYLYSLGQSIHPLEGLTSGTPFSAVIISLYVAQGALEAFLGKSVFQLKVCYQAGLKLFEAIKKLTVDTDRQEPLNSFGLHVDFNIV